MMKLNRRLHLYLGLFMTPWVVMYAVSGFLFNHHSLVLEKPPANLPGIAGVSGIMIESFEMKEMPATPIDARAMAEKEIAAFNADAKSPQSAWTLEPHTAVHGNRFLNFGAECDGKLYRFGCNLESGTVTCSAVAERAPGGIEQLPLSIRQFFLKMHVAAGYPNHPTLRWWWAVGVDASAVVMVFWVVSGLIMWYQLKNTWLLGAIVVVLALAMTWILGAGMHDLVTAPADGAASLRHHVVERV